MTLIPWPWNLTSSSNHDTEYLCRFGQNPSAHSKVITITNVHIWPWSDLDLVTFMARICHLCTVLYYALKFGCDHSSHSGNEGPQIFAHLKLHWPWPLSLELQNVFSLSVTSNTSTKVWWHSVSRFVRYRANRKLARIDAHTHTHSQTDNPKT